MADDDRARSRRRDLVGQTSHRHGHDHDGPFIGGWRGWRRDPARAGLVALVVVLAFATVVGLVALWPGDDAGDELGAGAEEIGLAAELVTARVTAVTDAVCSFAPPESGDECRTFELEVTNGPQDGDTTTLPELSLAFRQNIPPIGVGDDVVLNFEPETGTYSYADQDRRSSMIWLTVLFAVVVVVLGRLRGALALAGMATTVVVLVGFIAPSVLDGNDPVLVAVVGASAIALVSLYLTHGVTPATTVALVSTIAALGLTLALSAIFFELAGFTGLASDTAAIVPFLTADIDLGALLLGGAVLGALGALDDVTVTQVATVDEIRRQRPDLATASVVASGIRVGRAHIASTVNTLLLAYAGAGIPLLLLFAATDRSLTLVANSEAVAVEIVRTMCGSIGLVAAVPIATALAAIVMRPDDDESHEHRPGPQSGIDPPPPPPPPDGMTWEDFGPDREFWSS